MEIDRRTFPEMVEDEISRAINAPGLQHITTTVKTCSGEGKVSAYIDFIISGKSSGVRLYVNSDSSLFLIEPTEGGSQSTDWTAEEATPEKVCAVVLDVLRARVAAAA